MAQVPLVTIIIIIIVVLLDPCLPAVAATVGFCTKADSTNGRENSLLGAAYGGVAVHVQIIVLMTMDESDEIWFVLNLAALPHMPHTDCLIHRPISLLAHLLSTTLNNP